MLAGLLSLIMSLLQLAEAEAELDEMTKSRDELQALVEELEEKVMHLHLTHLLTHCSCVALTDQARPRVDVTGVAGR